MLTTKYIKTEVGKLIFTAYTYYKLLPVIITPAGMKMPIRIRFTRAVELNGRPISIISEALGGTNVDNCPHACVARPCGPLAKCVPHLENYECQCNPTNALCNKAEELSSESISMVQLVKSTKSTAVNKITKGFVPDNTTPYPIEYATESSNSHSGLVLSNITDYKKQPATTHVVGRYMSVDNEQLLKEDRQQNDEKLKKIYGIKNSKNKKAITYKSDRMSAGSSDGEYMTEAQINDETGMNFYSEDDVLTTKELIDDMERIMKNGEHIRAEERHKTTKYVKKNHGACFTGADSYFHYNDAETMREIISYKIDLNLRFKTHSTNGLILWTGRHSALEDDDYLSLGIENGYLHMRYNLGSGEVNIVYNSTRVSDGLWHRIRALRSLQEGTLEVDGGRTVVKRSPGKLRQLNTDTGLYVGGMPEVTFYTRRRYLSGIVGCISEIVLTGELRLSLNPETLGTAHNVEPGIF
ncbi:Pikachurin [Pseudolycoriella hygida]|uniref:Pikachurin n=1 Tax=Pseudolycoriella hygida TaxID=35572 RepID=A0A9Q0MR12_9DIPT|nr:Pikachurin [Pseudolycoriella hygida]